MIPVKTTVGHPEGVPANPSVLENSTEVSPQSRPAVPAFHGASSTDGKAAGSFQTAPKPVGTYALRMTAIATGLLLLGMMIPPTVYTRTGNAPGQQLVVGSILLSVAGLLTSCFGLIRGRLRHLPTVRARIAASLCLAVAIAGSVVAGRQIAQLSRADEREATYNYWNNLTDIKEAISYVSGPEHTPSNYREASQKIQGLCADIAALPASNVEDDVVAHARQFVDAMENYCDLILEHQNNLDGKPAKFSEQECLRRMAAFTDGAHRIGDVGRTLTSELPRRFAGVVPHTRPNRAWARVALSCVDEATDASLSKSVPEISKAFGHHYEDNQTVTVSMESLETSLDMLSIVKEFGPPDRSYRMDGNLRHVYGQLVLVTPEMPAHRPRELPVLRIGAPYSWWVGGIRRRAIEDLRSEKKPFITYE